MTPLLVWRRAIVDRSGAYAGHRRLWPSACGRYRVVWRDEAFGVALPPQYHAMYWHQVNGIGVWALLSRHRKKHGAQAACEGHARRNASENTSDARCARVKAR